ncbi:MAG TPA: glycosyltransferase family 2 protein [Ilumatobacter sp.]|nr:glycosyltransferase family 2 protein [Ilumatobacter sp.]
MSWQFLFGPVVTALSVAVLVMLVANLMSIPRLRSDRRRTSATIVSVLVPARDEAATIATCLAGLTRQDHTSIEVIVLDDGSVDDTAAIVKSFADRGVRLVRGEPVPDGWTGKNWACDQLARQATGDVLCFVDADTELEPAAVGAALAELESQSAGLVTLLLAAERRTFAQAVFLPIVNHALMALFPVWLMHRPAAKRVALGLGPFMMVTREAYDAVGGHAAAPDNIVDDVALSRAIKGAGYPVRLANGTELARTRWYSTVGDICRGFSKNAFGALDYNLLLALATVFVMVPLLCAPFLRVLVGVWSGSLPGEALVQVLLILGARVITSLHGNDPLAGVLLHPLALAVWGTTLAWSVVLATTDRTVVWRGRDVPVRTRGG